MFLSELDGTLEGLLVLRTALPLSSPEEWAEITEVYVLPASRRRGVGRALIEASLEHSRKCGCTELHLLVDPENVTALSFYRAVGFRRDSWEMRREI